MRLYAGAEVMFVADETITQPVGASSVG